MSTKFEREAEEALWITRKWIYHNPYNLKPKGELGWSISERSLGQSDEPVDELGLALTASWLAPVYLAKGLSRVGVLPAAHYGYWRSAAIIPRGLAIVGTANLLYLGYLGHQSYQFMFETVRGVAKTAQPKVHLGGHRSFPNPIGGPIVR